MKILFLCSGNIHRSALAEAMLRREAARDGRDDIEVSSAGTLGLPPMPAAEEAVALAREEGIDLTQHRSRSADEGLLLAADLVFAMEENHLRWVDSVCPEATARCRLLSAHAGPDSGIAAGEDVPDAMGEDLDSFRHTFRIIRDCVARLYRELPPPPEAIYTRAIEERFRLRRRSATGLSTADYDLMDRWWTRGVPLWIVLEAIDRLLGRRESAGDAGRVRRLAYCEDEVERLFASSERVRVTRGGARADAPPGRSGGEGLLYSAAARLREAARRAMDSGRALAAETLESAARELDLTEAAEATDAAGARLRLHAVDEALGESLRRCLPPHEIAALREEAESALAVHRDRMTPAALAATVERYVRRRILEIFGILDLTAPPPD